MRVISFFFALFIGFSLQAQRPYPQDKTYDLIAYTNAILHIGNGQKIENGTLVVSGEKILFSGKTEDFNKQNLDVTQIIDLEQKHIYPGFILLNSTVGLREVDAVKATLDYNETGDFNPNARALISYNTDSKIIPTIRSNGVLMIHATPKGGSISGTSSLFAADAWNWEDAVIKADDGIHFTWPQKYQAQGWWAEQAGFKENKRKDSLIAEYSKILEDAKFYTTQKTPRLDLRLEALKGLFDGSKILYLEVANAYEIIEAVSFFKQRNIPKIVLKTNYEAVAVKDFLSENKVPVILERLFSLPLTTDADFSAYYQAPKELLDAKVITALDFSGDMEAMNSRNLPFAAGAAVGYGVDDEDALKMITLTPAQILGVDNITGSLEAGKQATFFISKGNALEIIGNNITDAYIIGAKIKIENHQTELYETYLKKYNLK